MVHHVVMFTLKDPAQLEPTVEVLRAMAGRIPTLRAVEVGVEARPSERSADVCLVTRFDDWEGLDAYAVHPHHQQVLDHMATVVARSVKVDWADPPR